MKKGCLIFNIIIVLFTINIANAQDNYNPYLKNQYPIIKSSSSKTLSTISNKSLTSNNDSVFQVADDINGRLFYLCKTWGYFKYFNQKNCTVKWDTILNTAIKNVLLTTNNQEFNNELMNMFNITGNNTFVSSQNTMPDTNINFNNIWINDSIFSQNTKNFLDTFSLYIKPDSSSCLLKKNDYSDQSYNSLIDFRNDQITMSLDYTKESDRLNTMFYYWNVINYFFPYKSIMDQSWDVTLNEFIPIFRQASNAAEFNTVFLKLVTKINDTHGYTSSSVINQSFWGGYNLPQIYLNRVGNNCVVAKAPPSSIIHEGDILTAIKDIPLSIISDSLSNYIPASTPAAFYREMYYKMLL
ncbi:MAG: hypothetical protein WCK02_14390 [Bacteroidota bacterium]